MDDYLVIPSAGHYAALQQALALNRFEQTDGSRFPRARLEKGGTRGYAELRPVTPEQELLMAPEEAEAMAAKMWQQREDLSDLDADVLDAISAAWLERGPRSASERVPIYVDDLLRSRGLRPKKSGHGRRGGFESEQRADLWRCLLHLQDLWLDIAEATVVDQDARGRRTQRTRAAPSHRRRPGPGGNRRCRWRSRPGAAGARRGGWRWRTPDRRSRRGAAPPPAPGRRPCQ